MKKFDMKIEIKFRIEHESFETYAGNANERTQNKAPTTERRAHSEKNSIRKR